ncbi:hypothetical protein [Sulfuracidifex tepidarius]|uniref:Uncharacterized protein n=1 Tax=Sulfuracidifex tepidarius TaxID=1294262 RepID=A0A510DTU0_9CREN|nr:hypothetical protein [Sulfuracidifex tepidarius]BBG23642.1 hypothetical protein IC006_0930 [Sulfuracidifex tepidarius]BBG26389.1 hypothetical protein IC007_0897 [Sulfuracidifex tepidarius]
MNIKYLFQGNVVSLVASLVILAELVLLDLKGLNFIFSLPSVVILWVIWAMAIPSVLSYHNVKLEKQRMLDVLGTLAVIIAGIGLVFLSLGKFLGVELILLGYFFEPLAGVPIFLTARKIKPAYSSLFFWGAVVFTTGLPLYLFGLGPVAIVGDVVKMIGLVGLLVTLNTKSFLPRAS